MAMRTWKAKRHAFTDRQHHLRRLFSDHKRHLSIELHCMRLLPLRRNHSPVFMATATGRFM